MGWSIQCNTDGCNGQTWADNIVDLIDNHTVSTVGLHAASAEVVDLLKSHLTYKNIEIHGSPFYAVQYASAILMIHISHLSLWYATNQPAWQLISGFQTIRI